MPLTSHAMKMSHSFGLLLLYYESWVHFMQACTQQQLALHCSQLGAWAWLWPEDYICLSPESNLIVLDSFHLTNVGSHRSFSMMKLISNLTFKSMDMQSLPKEFSSVLFSFCKGLSWKICWLYKNVIGTGCAIQRFCIIFIRFPG